MMLNDLKGASTGLLQFFSDDKILTIGQLRNAGNDHWIAVDQSQVQAIFALKKSAAETALGVLFHDGSIIHFPRTKRSIRKCIWMSFTMWLCGGRRKEQLESHTISGTSSQNNPRLSFCCHPSAKHVINSRHLFCNKMKVVVQDEDNHVESQYSQEFKEE